MKNEVVIFGVGSYAKLAHAYLTGDSQYRPVAFAVDPAYVWEGNMLGVPVIASDQLADLYPPDRCSMLVAIGYRKVNQGRIEVYERYKQMGYSFVTYVHSSVLRTGPGEIGENTFVFEAAVIQPYAMIGNNCVLWSGCQILHDSVIEDHCFIGSHVVVGGYATVGRSSFVGLNATIRDHVKVAPGTVVGAAATIMKDTVAGAVHSMRTTEPNPSRGASDLDDL
jgi:sugar O-acyltransferase (sialic acid O-acetyltransferase NeuD family)